MSEKLDGVRAIWTGSTFLSRLGNPFYAPAWFTKKLPKDRVLDGELFTARGDFQKCVSIVRTQDNPDAWKFTVSYRVFDIPSERNLSFEDRMKSLKKLFEFINGPDGLRTPWLRLVDHEICKNKAHLIEKLDEMGRLGGEGMMIREPGSLYEEGRSKTLLKVKRFLDCDAIVRGHEQGQGRNAGVCGALRCEMLTGVGGKPNGVFFKCGSGLTDKLRSKPPKIGSVIIVKYQELSKSGNPRFPTFQGVRAD
ncbi:DNA ligase/mRNA capping enzyme [Ascobolus immersus RN42]|uniref:DNA ligase/mRNA capping enzyme n=1 Tax=Ascobolus immersus RN42 TaxID=1160509 RepID=A0A3N4I9N9_ASCIM|nr:DNA ligase/mRNA capping enzyme [Ascobolus immersus RN42]